MQRTFSRFLAPLGLAWALLIAFALPAAAQQPASAAEYRLGAGDVVRISVYQMPDLQLEARLSEAGVISYPLLGSVSSAG
jgi:polysaccharide export outer membrane protein